MSGGARLLGWAMVLLWLTWGLALEGWLAARPAIALWVPNLGLLFFLAIGARLGRKLLATKAESVGSFGLILAAVLAEGALSSLSTAAVWVGWLLVWNWQLFCRRGFDVEEIIVRPWLVGIAAWLLLLWRDLVLHMDLRAELSLTQHAAQLFDQGAWRGVLVTAVLAPMLMPLCLRLPGVQLYWQDR